MFYFDRNKFQNPKSEFAPKNLRKFSWRLQFVSLVWLHVNNFEGMIKEWTQRIYI